MRGRIGHRAAVVEFAVFDQHLARAAQNTVLAIIKPAVADREVLPFGADAGTVAVGNTGTGEFNVLHDHVVASDHPDGLAARVLAIGRELGTSLADATNGDLAGPNRGNVAAVLAGSGRATLFFHYGFGWVLSGCGSTWVLTWLFSRHHLIRQSVGWGGLWYGYLRDWRRCLFLLNRYACSSEHTVKRPANPASGCQG